MQYATEMPSTPQNAGEDDLPFSPPLPPRKTRHNGLLGAIKVSLIEGNLKPIRKYFFDNWHHLKKYPGIFVVALAIVASATWWLAKWWYVIAPYDGETKLTLFFPDDGTEPQPVNKANIYRAATMIVEMQMTSPKNEKEILIGKARVWIVTLVFEKEINTEQKVLQAKPPSPDVRTEIREFSARSATVLLEPRNALNPKDPTTPIMPKGYLQIEVIKRVPKSG